MVNTIPYTYQRKVQWGEADPARIAYTARFFDYALEAIDSWTEDCFGYNWFTMNTELGMGSPMVHVELDFSGVLVPGDVVTISVRVHNMSRSTITFDVEGIRADGSPSFTGRLVSCMIDPEKRKSIEIPADFRSKVSDYMAACDKT